MKMDGIIKTAQVAKPLKAKTEPKKEESAQKNEIKEIKWETWEYEYIPKSNNWFWVVGIITIGLATASVLLDNILFAIFVALAGFTISLYASRKPKKRRSRTPAKRKRKRSSHLPIPVPRLRHYQNDTRTRPIPPLYSRRHRLHTPARHNPCFGINCSVWEQPGPPGS